MFVIGVGAIGLGFTAKNVFSYPTKCMSEEVVHDFVRPEAIKSNFTIF